MPIIFVVFLFLGMGVTGGAFCMDEPTPEMRITTEADGDYEGCHGDVRWLVHQVIKDYKNMPAADVKSFKGCLKTSWDRFHLLGLPAIFVTAYGLNFLSNLVVTNILVPSLFGIEVDVDTGMKISGAYEVAQSIFITWWHKDRKFKEKTE